MFQEDNATIYTSASTKLWLERNNVKMDWPVFSPDLKFIENLLGIIVRSYIGKMEKLCNIVQSIDLRLP